MKEQKLVEIPLYPTGQTSRDLTEAAEDGYRFGGIIDEPPRNSALVWLNRAGSGSLFRVWYVSRDSRGHLEPSLQRLLLLEGVQGFRLVASRDAHGQKKGTYLFFERLGDSQAPLRIDKEIAKQGRPVTGGEVPCPVIGCTFTAPKMAQGGVNLDGPKSNLAGYLCPHHRIYASPSTFEYEDPSTSMIWPGDTEATATAQVLTGRGGKRTWSRMGRERDEDSVTWNVFRYLERVGDLDALLKKAGVHVSGDVKPIYWSVDAGAVWPPLVAARKALGEDPARGSEPDIILETSSSIVIVEVKFTAPSVTSKDPIPAYYDIYAQKNAPNLFTGNVTAAVGEIGYELTRFFLLAHALGAATRKQAHVVSLTCEQQDGDLEQRVARAVSGNVSYARITWDDVQKVVLRQSSMDATLLHRYLEGKTAGYDSKGKLLTLL